MSIFSKKPLTIPSAADALPGRVERMPVPDAHFVNGNRLTPPFPDGLQRAVFGMGCFWGAERKFWQLDGVYSTAVGYAAGHTPNPTYQEVCGGGTGHAEVVQLKFDPSAISFEEILQVFFSIHDPTTLNRQGNDVGTQYRSAFFFHSPEQERIAREVIKQVPGAVTEITPAEPFWIAEDYHQEYFARNPNAGYCQFVVSPKVAKFRKVFAAKRK